MSIHLGLERVRRLATHLERFKRPTVHVAGTNGKGSVTSIIASILHASGLSIGRFNSPHLVSVHDAILVNGNPVSPSVYDHARSLVIAADQHLNTAATPFELLTLTALQIFEAAKLDIVVIEVGMGGRDDATNVIPDDCILVSVLTAVDLDHQKFLGDTIESIAEHKAGIARSGKPFVLGPQRYPIAEVAARRIVEGPEIRGHFIISTPVRPWYLDEEYRFSPSERPFASPPGQPIEFHSTPFTSPIHAKLPLHGTHQLDNLSLSLTVISTLVTHTPAQANPHHFSHRITAETVRAGIESVSWPGRLTFHTLSRPVTVGSTLDPPVVLADGAHNAASAELLASYISGLMAQLKPGSKLNITYIVALSHSPPKKPFDTLSPIFLPHGSQGSTTRIRVAALRFTPPEGMPWVTSVPPLEIQQTVRQMIHLGDEYVWAAPDDLPWDSQLLRAFEWAEAERAAHTEENLVVITGSLYLVADFYRLLNLLKE
ncbi:Mur ligase [Boletus coccyginus]|nr:Mur ligase [Boletus coccyginus]